MICSMCVLLHFSTVTMFEKTTSENGSIRRNAPISYWLEAMPKILALICGLFIVAYTTFQASILGQHNFINMLSTS